MVVSDLLESGADINFQDASGYTALMLACLSDSVDTTQLLLEYDADVTITDKKGV